MRFVVSVSLIFISFFSGITAKGQIDPSWLYFKYTLTGEKVPVEDMTPGNITVDIRTLIVPNQDYFYLDETKTFSYRQANGLPTNTYHAMAGFNSVSFTEGNLRRVFYGSDQYVQNYRLRFPNNYDPNYPNGYPLILMAHGYGERANCWGSNCYWTNTLWNPVANNLDTKNIVSVEKESVSSNLAVFNTSTPHGFTTGTIVYLNTTVAAYNGVRTLTSINATKFKVAVNFPGNGTATGTVARNVAATLRVTSVSNSGGQALFTTSAPHQFVSGQSVIIANSSVGAYNGTKTINFVDANTNQFRVSSTSYVSDATADVARSGIYNLLNNDHNMSQGGNTHLLAANRVPVGMLPDDPAMPVNAFPGFLFFPQNLNGWSSQDPAHTLRALQLLIETHNIDPNRIYIHGLSDGGAGTYVMVRSAPWMFAAAAPMSGVNNGNIVNNNLYPNLADIPFWIFQGGKDTNPLPSTTLNLVNQMTNRGLSARYKVYPNLGHGVWNNAYAEPDFWTWLRSKNKANPHVLFGSPEICGTNGKGATMVLADGFFAYQWEKDGEIVPDSTYYRFTANFPGTYRARFSRVENPSENDWNRWSDPIVITENYPAKPEIIATSSTVYPSFNNSNPSAAKLRSKDKAEKYLWFQNGVQMLNVSDTASITPFTLGNAGIAAFYTLKTTTAGGCESPVSDPVYHVLNAPKSLTAPTNFVGIPRSASSIFLSWTDNSPNDNGFEVWRKKSTVSTYTFVKLTKEDVVSFLDEKLEANTIYHYKLRAVSNTGQSEAAPGQFTFITVTTLGDTNPPTPPQNVQVTVNSINSISLTWGAATDDNGIKQYIVTYGGSSLATGSSSTTFTIPGLPINTSYVITVKAEDFSLNQSSASNQVIGTTFIDGLFYEHTAGAWKSLDPAISAANNNPPGTLPDAPPINWTSYEYSGKMPAPTNPTTGNPFNVQPFANDSKGIAVQEEFYSIKFDGYLNIPTNTSPLTQTYQFRTTSDEGSMLFLEGFDPQFRIDSVTKYRYLNNDFQHTITTVQGPDRTLSPGPHRIVVLYFEYTGTQSLFVEYRIKTTQTSNGQPVYTNWAAIPISMLRTGVYTPPTPPVAPNTLSANATGLTTIDLAWLYGGAPTDEFEIYRSTASNGTYTMLGRVTGLSFNDTNLQANTTYYYKVKTVNVNGASIAFSNIANATTLPDAVIPSVPAGLTLASKTYSNVAFYWTNSTDNVGVAGYEILINGTAVDTTTVSTYMAENLAPGTLYNFTIKAFDAAGNKSAASATLADTTNSGAMYYSKAGTDPLNVNASWGNNTDGTGTAPDFTYNGQIYTIANRVSTGLGGPLTIGGSISKIIVPAGTTLDVDNTISAKIEVQGDGVVNLNNSTAPEFVSLSSASTVNFNSYATVQPVTYGNVNFAGSGNKNFQAGETVVMGNLTAASDAALKGTPGNATHLTIYGNLTLSGTPALVAPDNAIDLTFAKNGAQTFTSGGNLDFFKISTGATTSLNLVNTGSALTLNLGSLNGGGLSLASGSAFNLGSNHLILKNAGTINANGGTGTLATNGSNLDLTSSSTQNSNLYFDATLKTAGLVTSNFSGSGKLMIQSPVLITDGLKIKAGEVNAAGNVTLVSTSTKTAYLQEIESNGSITGSVNVQRWVSAVRKYRYMSSVVANMKVADWQLSMPITGPFDGANTNSTVASTFYYVENDGGYKQYPPSGGNNQVTFAKGRGYSIFNYNGNNSLTLTMNGNPYQGNVVYTSLLTPNATNDNGLGWNLIGNPYASAIQWNNVIAEWTKNGLAPNISVPDNSSGTLVFKTWDAGISTGTLTDGIIAPGQAFWVRTINGAPTLTVTEKAKRTSNSALYREGSNPANHFVVQLSNGTQQDNAYVILGAEYADVFEPETDGMKYKNQVVNLSTRSSDNVNLVFNKLLDSFCEKTIALNLEDVATGNYSLSFASVANLVGVGEIILTDNFTSTTTVVNDSDQYNFAVSADANSKGAGRFALTLNRPALQKNAVASVENLCGGTTAAIQLTNTQPGAFYYVTLANETNALSAEYIGDGSSLTINVPVESLQSGANNLHIHTGFKGCSNEVLTETPLNFTYTLTPYVRVDESYFSICEGLPLTLHAETESSNTYRWYTGGNLIDGQTGSTLLTDLIKKSTTYEVAAVTSNGCEGPRSTILVETEKVDFPFLEHDGEALTIVGGTPENIFVQWYKDQEPLEVYTPFIQPTEEGQYTVLVSKNGCSKISDPFQYVVTAIEPEPGDRNEFAAYVYPNPATSKNLYVKIETPYAQDTEITMMDLAGRKAYSTVVGGNQINGVHKLNIPEETPLGMYILSIRQGDAVLQRKVIITF